MKPHVYRPYLPIGRGPSGRTFTQTNKAQSHSEQQVECSEPCRVSRLGSCGVRGQSDRPSDGTDLSAAHDQGSQDAVTGMAASAISNDSTNTSPVADRVLSGGRPVVHSSGRKAGKSRMVLDHVDQQLTERLET